MLDANKNVIITAREVPQASKGTSLLPPFPKLTKHIQLVMIHPKIHYDASSPTKGKLVISVPSDAGPISFSVPLEPTPDILASWPM